jgi:DNA-binding response OmpR family regulator
MDVLLVEDDEVLRATLAEALADEGIHVTDVSGPNAALDIPDASGPPTMLITDVNLGVAMDGFALAAAARQRWPAIRIIVMSGRPENLNGHQLHPSDRFLPKPFRGGELFRVIQELMSDLTLEPNRRACPWLAFGSGLGRSMEA